MIFPAHGVNIYYESIGSGLPVIMIHGWGPDHRSFRGCLEPLFSGFDQTYQRVYFDLPGLGQTKGNEWVSSTDKMLELVLDFIDGIVGDKPFLLAGESYGGYLARGVVKKKQSLVAGVFLKCPLARHETQFAHAPEHRVLEKDDSLIEILTAEDKSYFEPVAVIQTKAVWERFKEEILPGLKIADHSYINEHWGKRAPCSFNVDELQSPFEKPALILMGKQDSLVGYADSYQFLKNFPRASFVVLDSAGHNLQIEQPELFGLLVIDWLVRVSQSRKAKEDA